MISLHGIFGIFCTSMAAVKLVSKAENHTIRSLADIQI